MTDDLADFHEWFAERARTHEYRVTRTPLEQMDGWRIDDLTGDIVHDSGRFFAVRGLRARTDDPRTPGDWSQPILVQPEIGILGLLARVADGEVQFLMQAKMEPGNINCLQLSPTVQATRSNYQQVHRGRAVPYLEHFRPPRTRRWVYDALQSEQGSWFLAKRNRNMIVQTDAYVEPHEDFRWLSLSQIAELLQLPNMVNMDARTVLSGLPFLLPGLSPDAWRARRSGVMGPVGTARHTKAELLSWFTDAKARHELTRELVPLDSLPEWERSGGEIVHSDGTHFRVVGVDVEATGREVRGWSQPLFAPCGRGLIGFVGRRFDGVFHVLVRAEVEAGTHDVMEIAPTVSCVPGNYTGRLAPYRPAFIDELLGADPSRVLVDVVHSEEGGRFYRAENRYMIVDAGEDVGPDVEDDYCWMTPAQLTALIRYANHVNVAARCLMSCLAGEPATLAAAA